jgi:hypothetical protein
MLSNLKFVEWCVNLLIGPTLGKLGVDEDGLNKNGFWFFFIFFYINLLRTGAAIGKEGCFAEELPFLPLFKCLAFTLAFFSSSFISIVLILP